MIVQSMDFARALQVYVVQGIGLFYLFMAYKILKRDKGNLNYILSSFFLSVGIGVIINMVYANLTIQPVVYLLHFITYYLFCFAMVFLLLFLALLLKTEKIITPKKQLIIIGTYGILLGGLWFIPGGITINESTDWKPVWNLPFFWYSIILCSVMVIIPTVILSIKVYQKIQHAPLRKKWLFFIVGISAYFFVYYGTSLSNTLNDPDFRILWSFLTLPTLITTYLVYYGLTQG
ncbi:MAG: hypothetical protein EU544_05230 [Promethearchaeota archaeon]|nr:MAG: hypothetical protein EU544_05230 [Candidatus Lokiarchaeota archaeon]